MSPPGPASGSGGRSPPTSTVSVHRHGLRPPVQSVCNPLRAAPADSGNIHCRGGRKQNKILPTRHRTAYSLPERTTRPVGHSPEGVEAEAAGMLAVGSTGTPTSGSNQMPEPDAVRAGPGPGRAAMVRDLRDRPPRVRARPALHAGREPAAGDRARVLRGGRRDRPRRHRLRPGDRVAVLPHVFCGSCYYCLRGRQGLCSNLQLTGVTWPWGGLAGQAIVPASPGGPAAGRGLVRAGRGAGAAGDGGARGRALGPAAGR